MASLHETADAPDAPDAPEKGLVHLPTEILMDILDRTKMTDLYVLCGLSRHLINVHKAYLRSLKQEERSSLVTVGREIFKSHCVHGGQMLLWILGSIGPMNDISFLVSNLSQEDLVVLWQHGHLQVPQEYPAKVPQVLLKKLPLLCLYRIWESKFNSVDVEEVTFSSRKDLLDEEDARFKAARAAGKMGGKGVKVLLGGIAGKVMPQLAGLLGGLTGEEATPEESGPKALDPVYEFNQVSTFVICQLRDRLVINDKFLRLMCYWSLYMTFVDLFQMRRFFGKSLEDLLPWVLLFRKDESIYILDCIGEELRVKDYRYLRRYLPAEMIINMTGVWFKHIEYQRFLRTLGPYDPVFLWLKEQGRRYVRRLPT